MSIVEEEIYYKGEYEGIMGLTRDLYYFKPLFIYDKIQNNCHIYYNELDLEEDPSMMYYYMDKDFEKVKECYEQLKEDVKYLNNVIKSKNSIKIEEFIDKLIFVYPFSSLG